MSISEAENNISHGRRLLAEAPVNKVVEAWEALEVDIDTSGLSDLLDQFRAQLTPILEDKLPDLLSVSKEVYDHAESALGSFRAESITQLLVGNDRMSLQDNTEFIVGRSVIDEVVTSEMSANLNGILAALNFAMVSVAHYRRSQSQGLQAAQDNVQARAIALKQADAFLGRLGS